MALRAAKGDEDALGICSARTHACRVDDRVDARSGLDRVFNGAVGQPSASTLLKYMALWMINRHIPMAGAESAG
jgi:hypothetical protein